jgi:hypothetical protein
MSADTFYKNVTKRLNFVGAGEEILVFNDLDDPNAEQVLSSKDGTTMLDVCQSFNRIVVINTSASENCYFSLYKNIVASDTATDQVMCVLPSQTLEVKLPFTAVRVYLGAAGVVYVSAFSQ